MVWWVGPGVAWLQCHVGLTGVLEVPVPGCHYWMLVVGGLVR